MHARTGVTLNAPPPFFEWRGHKKKSHKEGRCPLLAVDWHGGLSYGLNGL